MGVSIWSWIGGYLLAFCGIHHHPTSLLSLTFLLLLPYILSHFTLMILWTLEFGYLTDMNDISFQVLFFYFILPVAFSFWVLCWCLISCKRSPKKHFFFSLIVSQTSQRLWRITSFSSMFEFEKNNNTVLPFQYPQTPLLHCAPENYSLPEKARLPPKPHLPFGQFSCILIKLHGCFMMPLGVSVLTVPLDFCVTLLFWAASSKKFPLNRASKWDHWVTKCLLWYAAGSCKPNPTFDLAPLPEKTFKGLMLPFSYLHLSAARRKSQRHRKKSQHRLF